jgi:hypothetical protein
MEAPNLERTSSLTWGGIGGLNWDRNSVINNSEGNINNDVNNIARRGIRGSSFSHVSREPSPPPLPPAVVDALLGAEDDEDGMGGSAGATSPTTTAGILPPPTLLRRSVTFSGDFPHDPQQDGETLVATPPTGLLLGGQGVHQRQRATSDAAAVKAAWGGSSSQEAGSLSPEAAIFSPYSPVAATMHKVVPRRSHSMSMEPTVWGSGSESPRERSRTSHTLSVGSPDTEVLEYLDGDDLSYGVGAGTTRLTQFASPNQQALFTQAQPQQQGLVQPQPQQQQSLQRGFSQSQPINTPPIQQHPSLNTVSQQHQPPQPAIITASQQSQFAPPRLATPPYGGYPPNMHGNTPPSMLAGANSPQPMLSSDGTPQDQNLLEIQLQNLQAMQQQWMQMMQMQFDQTLYATQQRLQNMQVGGGTPPNNLPFAPPKVNKYSSNPGGGAHPVNPNAVPFEMYQQQQQAGASMGVFSNGSVPQQQSRSSPPTNRPHRRQNQQHQDNGMGAVIGGGNYANNQTQQQPQSTLLAEHKITGKRLSAQELAGHVVEFSKDSHGSRLIQFKMETGTLDERRAFVNEALPHTLALARDLFGNYVVQNFFDNAAPDQRDMLAIALMGNVSSLCTHPHGCRVVQRALFVVSPPRRNDLIEELLELQSSNTSQTETIVRSCARDAHATHVLQKAVGSLQRAVGVKSAYRDPVIPEDAEDPMPERTRAARALERIEAIVLQDCISMCTHQQACRLVQRVLGACEPGKLSPRVIALLSEVFKNIDALSIHQNGNFVLQHILESTEPGLASKVQAFVCANAVKLARHKFGSHLVEKSLQCATQAQVNAIIEKFLAPLTPEMRDDFKEDFESSANDDVASGLIPSTLPVLMKDPYANFVVQKAFDVARGELRAKLSSEIRARTASLSKFSYGRHILTHINRANGAGGGAAPLTASE